MASGDVAARRASPISFRIDRRSAPGSCRSMSKIDRIAIAGAGDIDLPSHGIGLDLAPGDLFAGELDIRRLVTQ